MVDRGRGSLRRCTVGVGCLAPDSSRRVIGDLIRILELKIDTLIHQIGSRTIPHPATTERAQGQSSVPWQQGLPHESISLVPSSRTTAQNPAKRQSPGANDN